MKKMLSALLIFIMLCSLFSGITLVDAAAVLSIKYERVRENTLSGPKETNRLLIYGSGFVNPKVKAGQVSEIPIPVSYSPAFEGERVRREQMHVQFGGKFSKAFEYVRLKKLDEIEDNKIEVKGPEIDDMKEGSAPALGILVEVAGRKMQEDFTPILERQIHTFLNEAMGVFHMGQRNMCWVRISKGNALY